MKPKLLALEFLCLIITGVCVYPFIGFYVTQEVTLKIIIESLLYAIPTGLICVVMWWACIQLLKDNKK